MKQYWYILMSGLLSCLICTVRTALFTPVGSWALNSAVRTYLNNTVDNNVYRMQHNTVHACSRTALFTPVDNLQQVVRFYACSYHCSVQRFYNIDIQGHNEGGKTYIGGERAQRRCRKTFNKSVKPHWLSLYNHTCMQSIIFMTAARLGFFVQVLINIIVIKILTKRRSKQLYTCINT